MSTAAVKRAKKVFQDQHISSFTIGSSWDAANKGGNKKSVKCQTSPEIYQLQEMETQSGLFTTIMQDQVEEKNKHMTLLEHFCKLHKDRTTQEWVSSISEGFVTVDCEVATDTDMKVDTEFFLEYVDEHISMGTQTEPLYQRGNMLSLAARAKTTSSSKQKKKKLRKPKRSSLESKGGESKGDDNDGDEYNDQEDGEEEEEDDDDDDEEEGKVDYDDEANTNRSSADASPALAHFLRHAAKLVEDELSSAMQSKAFELIGLSSLGMNGSTGEGGSGPDGSSGNMDGGAKYFNMFSVDLEKKKVVFPDWSKARHHRGTITRRTVTRNKERTYEIEFEDGSILNGVREEYIRVVGDPYVSSGGGGGGGGGAGAALGGDRLRKSSVSGGAAGGAGGAVGAPPLHMLQEGMRVHAKVASSRAGGGAGARRYLPGRIVRRTAAGKSGAAFDVECEGSRIELGLTADDLLLGLTVGQSVEARRPNKVHLQCTGVSWNATGNSVAAAYGRNDLLGWCEYPGAVCCWNIFNKNLVPDSPDFVLDHPSCLMCVSYHPVIPSLIAAGSFNGELIVWDLTNPEQPLAVSVISDYSHKEPVLDVQWVYHPLKLSSLKRAAARGGGRAGVGSAVFGSSGSSGAGAGFKTAGSGGSSGSAAVLAAAEGWLLCTVGADGRVLFWSLVNGLQHPVKGSLLAKTGRGSSSHRRVYPMSHGGTIATFGGSGVSGSASSSSSGVSGTGASKPKWVLIGQEGGSIVRAQVGRMLGGSVLTEESFRSLPPAEELFGSIKRGGGGGGGGEGEGDAAFSHMPHIGFVSGLQFSPFHRNLFLSGGADGVVRLAHMLERSPVREWEPRPPPSCAGVSSTFAPISAVRFSPHRPLVFAAASSEGFLFVYDLGRKDQTVPAAVIECPQDAPSQHNTIGAGSGTADGSSAGAAAAGEEGDTYGHRNKRNKQQRKRGGGDSEHNRVPITDIAFNPKQRGMIAACDHLGRVHVWMLPWHMSSVGPEEQRVLDKIGGLGDTDTNAAAAGDGVGTTKPQTAKRASSSSSRKSGADAAAEEDAGDGGGDDSEEERRRHRREERLQRRGKDGAGYGVDDGTYGDDA